MMPSELSKFIDFNFNVTSLLERSVLEPIRISCSCRLLEDIAKKLYKVKKGKEKLNLYHHCYHQDT